MKTYTRTWHITPTIKWFFFSVELAYIKLIQKSPKAMKRYYTILLWKQRIGQKMNWLLGYSLQTHSDAFFCQTNVIRIYKDLLGYRISDMCISVLIFVLYSNQHIYKASDSKNYFFGGTVQKLKKMFHWEQLNKASTIKSQSIDVDYYAKKIFFFVNSAKEKFRVLSCATLRKSLVWYRKNHADLLMISDCMCRASLWFNVPQMCVFIACARLIAHETDMLATTQFFIFFANAVRRR